MPLLRFIFLAFLNLGPKNKLRQTKKIHAKWKTKLAHIKRVSSLQQKYAMWKKGGNLQFECETWSKNLTLQKSLIFLIFSKFGS